MLAVIALSQAQESRRAKGVFSITGYVLDVNGNLVSGAEVHAMPIDRGGLVQTSVTSAGRFSISLDVPGKYRVYASRGDVGYKNITEELFTLDPEAIPEVVVTEQSPKQTTVVKLRSKQSSLTKFVISSRPGEPLDSAQLIVQRRDNQNYRYIRTLKALDLRRSTELLLPSLPLRIEVSAPGYETWSSTDSAAQLQPNKLLLERPGTREIVVQLRHAKRTR